MTGPPTFTILPHTADLRAALDAPDLAGLARAAADLVRTVLVADSPVSAQATRGLEPEAAEADERFFRFVRELLYWFDVDGFLPATVIGEGPWQVSGEAYDPRRHVIEHQVKALTRHGFVFRTTGGGYHVEMVLDL